MLFEGALFVYESSDYMGNFVDCVKMCKLMICFVEIGYCSVSLCYFGLIVICFGRKFVWDLVKE